VDRLRIERRSDRGQERYAEKYETGYGNTRDAFADHNGPHRILYGRDFLRTPLQNTREPEIQVREHRRNSRSPETLHRLGVHRDESSPLRAYQSRTQLLHQAVSKEGERRKHE